MIWQAKFITVYPHRGSMWQRVFGGGGSGAVGDSGGYWGLEWG